MRRVSPPEEDLEFPGPQVSIKVTFIPDRSKYKAVQVPNTPAPTTTADDEELLPGPTFVDGFDWEGVGANVMFRWLIG